MKQPPTATFPQSPPIRHELRTDARRGAASIDVANSMQHTSNTGTDTYSELLVQLQLGNQIIRTTSSPAQLPGGAAGMGGMTAEQRNPVRPSSFPSHTRTPDVVHAVLVLSL